MKRNAVIIADDDADDRFLIGEALRIVSSVRTVVEVSDGKELLDVINDNNIEPELLIVDVHMPRMNGLEVLDYIRSQHLFENVPKVVMSNDQGSHDRAMSAGGDGFYAKPRTLDGYLEIARRLYNQYLR